MNNIQIKLSPLLADELAYSVEAWLDDLSVRHENTEAEMSFGRKVEVAYKKPAMVLDLTLDEATALYNELWNMEDKIREWAEETDMYGRPQIKWRAVTKSLNLKLRQLRAFGVKVGDRGWAVKV